MKKLLIALACSVALIGAVDAKPGGGGGGGGHSFGGGGGGRSSFSAPSAPSKGSFSAPVASPAPRPAGPAVAPTNSPQKGSFSATPAAAPRQSTTTTTSTTTMTRRTGGGGYMSAPIGYGGFGMGYGYSNGLLTGLIIGNMMHPHNTIVYSGGGYNGNALLYPDGRVVNQQGYQVGTYQNGQFSPVNGGMVAQPAPSDALQYQSSQPVQTAPVVIKTGPSAMEIFGYVLGSIVIIVLIIVLIGVL